MVEMACNMEQSKLLNWISMVGFAAMDMAEYLDTHPMDLDAMEYYNHLNKMKNQAERDYAANYGPLTLGTFTPENKWCWSVTPWPWEGGM
ncbi:spore coat protein JB [Lachnospiraceae bacterium XBB1006]|nr:spore coat protein JB [Lachnospiraceae bacterium XBB1006]